MIKIESLKDEDGLCCCEYIDENGERAHMLSTFCNCNAIDEAFERLVSREEMRLGLNAEIVNAIEDRMRIPWPGGAKKVLVAQPLILNPLLIALGSLNFILTLSTYLFILPFIVYFCHRLIKRRRKILYLQTKHSSKPVKGNDNDFYIFWLASTAFYLLMIYYTQVIGALKISSSENFLFVLMLVSSWVCFYIVIKKGQQNLIESRCAMPDSLKTLKMCLQCGFEVTEDSHHCKICGGCFSWRDHHCLWLNICIGQVNDHWFFIGLVFALSSLLYGAQLTFTTVCHPKILHVASFEILYPYQCPNAYSDLSSSLMFSGGWYTLVLIGCISIVLMQQIYSISSGLRRRNSRNRYESGNILHTILANWYIFWKY